MTTPNPRALVISLEEMLNYARVTEKNRDLEYHYNRIIYNMMRRLVEDDLPKMIKESEKYKYKVYTI